MNIELCASTTADVLNGIYQCVLNLRHLKFYYAYIPNNKRNLSLPLNSSPPHAIEKLFLNQNGSLDDLLTILSCTPLIQRVEYFNPGDVQNYRLIEPIKLFYLTNLALRIFYIHFHDFERFMTNIEASNLNKLSVITELQAMDYLRANRWEQLITTCFPRLTIFSLEDDEFVRENIDLGDFPEEIKGFFLSFIIFILLTDNVGITMMMKTLIQ